MNTLYELDEHLQLLLEARAELQDVIECADSKLERDCKAELAECESDIARYTESMLAKVDGTAAVLRNLKAVEQTCKEEAQRIARRGRQAEADRKYLEGLVLSLMEQRSAKKLKGKFNTFTAADNGGKKPLEIRQPELVPLTAVSALIELRADAIEDFVDQFRGRFRMVRECEPNKEEIREAMEQGEAVPGCVLADRGKHLVIS